MQGFYSDLLYQPWHCTTVPLHSSWLKRDTIDRRTGLSVEEFKQQYELPNKPVILQNAVSSCFYLLVELCLSVELNLMHGWLSGIQTALCNLNACTRASPVTCYSTFSIYAHSQWRYSHLAAAPLLIAFFSASMTACWHQSCLCRRLYAAVFGRCHLFLGSGCVACTLGLAWVFLAQTNSAARVHTISMPWPSFFSSMDWGQGLTSTACRNLP